MRSIVLGGAGDIGCVVTKDLATAAGSDEVCIGDINLEKARIAFFDPRKLNHPDGIPKKLHELDADTAAALESFDIEIKTDKEGSIVSSIVKPRAAKKAPILDQLSKQRGMYEKDNDQKGGRLADLLDRVDGATRGLPNYQERAPEDENT